MNVCQTDGHNYQLLDPVYNNSGERTLVAFCTKCGETKKIEA